MPSLPRNRSNLVRVHSLYVSGIAGPLPVHVAVPYFFRGHYLYDEFLQPVEPATYANQTTLALRRAVHAAPPYEAERTVSHQLGTFVGDQFEVDEALDVWLERESESERGLEDGVNGGRDTRMNGDMNMDEENSDAIAGAAQTQAPPTGPAARRVNHRRRPAHSSRLSFSAPPTTRGTPPLFMYTVQQQYATEDDEQATGGHDRHIMGNGKGMREEGNWTGREGSWGEKGMEQ
ncbi:hypothetical protein K432DRAFT_438645 [Lepidopterella palustris CBS 459.81]|uniref:Uncharacterized protein n=1 Tax=Lepidopterella palustris CBS 459.81 TaxID=1314670 RepID=A0A8E2ELY0_9PEZI|nr:hypothetical protein K432DRAFT_438645 [Lepidopterella palustris CBS 459.81]